MKDHLRTKRPPKGLAPLCMFEKCLSVCTEDLQIELRDSVTIPWGDFALNPRRLRGSDFLMRWSQGLWSEHRVIQAVDQTGKYHALPYGPSGTAPDNDVREFELYFERLEAAGLGEMKRPDILIFRSSDVGAIDGIVQDIGGIQELPFTPENDKRIEQLLDRCVLAIECENSLWKAQMMPDYGSSLTAQRRLGNQLGLKKSAKVPTIIVKEEDRAPLLAWQQKTGVTIHVWHIFYDLAFGLALDDIEALIRSGQIEPTVQVFQAPGGAVTRKIIYKVWYQFAYRLGEAIEEPTLAADSITDKNGHILPYVRFEGGSLALAPEAFDILDKSYASKGRMSG